MRIPRARPYIAVVVLASVISGLAEAALLAVVAESAVAISSGEGTVGTHLIGLTALSHLTIPKLLMVGAMLCLLRLVGQVVAGWLPALLNSDMQVDLRDRILSSFLRSSWDAKSALAEGSLQEITTSLVDRAANCASALATGITSTISFVALVVSAILLGPLIALITGGTAALLFLVFRPLVNRTRIFAEQYTDAHATYSNATHEISRLGQEFQVFDATDAGGKLLIERALEVREPYLRRTILLNVLPGVYQSFALLLVLSGLAAIYVLGSGHIASLGAVALLLIRSFSYSQQSQAAFQQVADLLPACLSLEETIVELEGNAAAQGDRPLDHVQTIRLESVSFSYPERPPSLHDIDMTIRRGEAVGVVGPSGAGKSTLISILLRLRTPSEGRYLVNGSAADDYSTPDWWRLVSYVPQDTLLLSATVADNIRFLRAGIDHERVVAAARSAHLHDEIMALPNGYMTRVSNRTAALSGGQRQRLCLARALVGEPELLVLDEPTSSLDARSERLIHRTLEELKGKVTLIIIAHRPATWDVCTRVVHLRNGRLESDERVNPAGADK